MGQLNLRVLVQVLDRASGPLRGVAGRLEGLRRPGLAAGRVLQSIGRDLRNLALLSTAALSAVGLAAWNLTRRVAAAGDEAVKTSQKVGVGVEDWQRYAYAAKLADVESAGLADGLKFLNQSAAMAAGGAKGDAKAFQALGISIRDQKGQLKPTGALFEEVADRLSKMEDGAVKTSIAMTLFGRSGVELIPLLNAGADEIRRLGDEAEQLGFVIPEDQARAAEAFNDSITTLQTAVMGLGFSLAGGLIPRLTELVKGTTAWIGANKPAVIAKVDEVVTVLSGNLPALFEAFLSIVRVLGDLASVVGPIVRAIGGFGTVLDALAAIMIGRLAFAVWAAVKAVWGLNAAMLANPIGLVIAALAALVFAGWLLIRNWGRITKWWRETWAEFPKRVAAAGRAIQGAFKRMVEVICNLLPAWLKTLFRVGRYVVRVVGSGLGSGGSGGRTASPPAPPRPGFQRQSLRQIDPSAAIRVTLADDRAPRLSVKGADDRVTFLTEVTRGAYT
jgi:hypothetical protein